MDPTYVEPVSNWKSVLAAMLYLTTFVAVSYASYSLLRGSSFIDSLIFGLPRALLLSLALYAASVAFEAIHRAVKGQRSRAKSVPLQTFAHH